MTGLVVADLYQLRRDNGKFTKDGKTILRKDVKIDVQMMERYNEDSEESGKLYVVDQKATDENHEQRLINQERKAENERLRGINGLQIVEAAKSKPATSAKEKEVVPDDSKEKAIANYVELFGKKPHHNKSLESILEMISEKESELKEENEVKERKTERPE